MSLALLLMWTVSLSGQNVSPERAGGIVAVVGDTVITQSELDRRVAHGRLQVPNELPQPLVDWHRLERQREILKLLIDEKLILHRVRIIEKKDGRPYITEAHIDAWLVERQKRLKEEGYAANSIEDIYRIFRENSGMNRKETRQFHRDKMSIDVYMRREIFPKRVDRFVSPEESRYYYRSNIDLFTTPERITLRQIVIPRNQRDAQLAVETMVKALKEGADFVELARAYSEEVQDGQAGRLREYSFAEVKSWHSPLPQKLRQMKRGEVSEPIHTRYAIHFIKVEDVVSGTPEPFSRAHPKIQRLLMYNRHQIAEQKFLAEERQKTRVDIFLPELTEKVEPTSAIKDGRQKEIPAAPAGSK